MFSLEFNIVHLCTRSIVFVIFVIRAFLIKQEKFYIPYEDEREQF